MSIFSGSSHQDDDCQGWISPGDREVESGSEEWTNAGDGGSGGRRDGSMMMLHSDQLCCMHGERNDIRRPNKQTWAQISAPA